MYIKTFYAINKNTCGISALKSFLFYHSLGKIDYIDEDINHSSYSLKELKDIAFNYGIETEGIKIKELNVDYIPNYSLVLIKNSNLNHFVFYLYCKNNKVFIIDSSIGKITYLKEEFLSMFLGYVLIYKNKNNISKIKNKIDKIDLFLIIYEVILILPLLMLFTSFSYNGYINFIYILMYWFLYIVKRFIMLKLMKRFDKKIINIIKNNSYLNEENIINLYRYKEYKFLTPSKIVSFIFLKFIFFMFTLILPYGYLLSISYVICLLLDYFSYYKTRNILKDINNIENCNFLKYQKYEKLNELTNKYIKKYELIKLISILIMSIQLLIYYLITNSLSLISSLLIASIYLILNNNFYSINENYKKYQISKTIYKSLN